MRGIRLADGASVISMAILRAVAATPEERAAYVKHSRAMAKAAAGEGDDVDEASAPEDDEEAVADAALSPERIAELGAAEEVLLTVSTEGYAMRTSAYDPRRTGRGGQGLLAQDLTKRGGRLAASFPVDESDQILLVTDQGQLIRTPVKQVRMVGRNTSGVIIFCTSEQEHVVSDVCLADTGEDEADDAIAGEDAEGGEPGADGGAETPEA